ncbi:MAG TPA: hypothetical protein VFH22_01840 [Rhodocyclaceae bacterium]|nr:hypothetical protein [Rhodocyclaceae bacterium]
MRGLTPLQRWHRHAVTEDRRPRLGMTARDYARFLHEECFVPYREACERAGYSPEDDNHRQAATFVIAMSLAALTVLALVFVGG